MTADSQTNEAILSVILNDAVINVLWTVFPTGEGVLGVLAVSNALMSEA